MRVRPSSRALTTILSWQLVLSLSSAVLANLFFTHGAHLAEAPTLDGRTRIELPMLEPSAFRATMRYLYTGLLAGGAARRPFQTVAPVDAYSGGFSIG